MRPITERGSPANLDAEEGLLACCILETGQEIITQCIEAKITPDYFFKPAHQILFEAIRALYSAQSGIDEIILAERLNSMGQLEAVGGHAELNRLTNRIETTAHARYWLEIVREKALLRKTISTATSLVEAAYQGGDLDGLLTRAEASIADLIVAKDAENAPERGESAAAARKTAKLLKRAYAHAFDPSKVPPDEPPILTLSGKPIWHVGNLLAFIAPQKSGKTSSVSAFLASVMGEPGRDYLGFQGFNPHGLAVRYYDTEQSQKDFHWMNIRAIRRANVPPPPCFTALHLKRFSPRERQQIVIADIKAAHAAGGILLAVIDGIADLVEDFNDNRESGNFIAELMSLTETCRCGIACTLHVNPGKGSDKSRGHLGTMLEQKAETIILLSKERGSNGEIITIATKDARHGTLDNAPRFAWDDASKMHRTLAPAFSAARFDGKVEDLRNLAKDAIGGAKALPYMAIKKGMQDARGMGEKWAEKKIKEMTKAKIIDRDEKGFYFVCDQSENLDCGLN